MKRLLICSLASALCLFFSGCSGNSELESLKKENEALEAMLAVSRSTPPSVSDVPQPTDKSNTASNVGQKIEVQTEYGNYAITVLSASKAKELNEDGNYPIIVSLEIENISYNYGDSSDKYLMPWGHYRGGMKVADADKNILKFYDIRGPKEVHSPENIPVGYKEIGNYAFFPATPNVMPSNIEVQICYNNNPVGSVVLPVTE